MRLSKHLLLLSLGLLLTVFIVACSNTSSTEENTKDNEEGQKELHLISSDTIPTMDAHMGTDVISFQFIGATKEGLYRLGDNLELKPGIAKDHTVSKDGLTWTFNLRDDAKWSNGDPVTAHDFVYAWQRAVNSETGSEYGPYLMGGVIKNATAINTGEKSLDELGVKAKGDYTLIVTLEKPTPYFKSLTTRSTFMPLNQKFIEKQGENYATSTDTLLFNGPFKLMNWESTASSWNLEKNPKYWDAETVQVEKMTFDVVKDPQTAIDLYESSKVDRVDLNSNLVDKYASHNDFAVTPETALYYLKFNQTTSDALANVAIRKALSKAIDKQSMVDELLNDGSIVSNGFVPQNFAKHPETGKGFREINGPLVTYDVEKAQTLWQKGLKEIGKEKVELELLSSDGEVTKTTTEYIANQLEKNLPGLSIELKRVPFEQRLHADTTMNYDIELAGWGPSYLDLYTWLDLWLTDGGNNKMGYSNKEYDQLVKSTVDEFALQPVKRFEAFLKAEKIAAKDATVAPLYQSGRSQLISPKIEGVISRPFGPKYEYKWTQVAPTE